MLTSDEKAWLEDLKKMLLERTMAEITNSHAASAFYAGMAIGAVHRLIEIVERETKEGEDPDV